MELRQRGYLAEAGIKKIKVELKYDTGSDALSFRVPSEGKEWAYAGSDWQVDEFLKDNQVPRSAISDLKRRGTTVFKSASIEWWQDRYSTSLD